MPPKEKPRQAAVPRRSMPDRPEDRRRSRDRAVLVRDAWIDRDAGQAARGRGVVIERLEFVEETSDCPAHIEVWVGDPVGNDPHYRIFNPPVLVEDPRGSIVKEVSGRSGQLARRRYRVDPVAAVAEALALNGGARRGGGRR